MNNHVSGREIAANRERQKADEDARISPSALMAFIFNAFATQSLINAKFKRFFGTHIIEPWQAYRTYAKLERWGA